MALARIVARTGRQTIAACSGTPLDSARTHPRTLRCHPKGEIPPQPRDSEDAVVEQHPCPIPGCTRVFTGTRSGWDAHVASLRFHPAWRPDVTDRMERKTLFRREFPQFFGGRHQARPFPRSPGTRDAPEAELVLLFNLGSRRERLQDLLSRCSDHRGYEDPVYRFYHQSFKVYALQDTTQAIVAELQNLVPGRSLNRWFTRIVAEGTGHVFTTADNERWPAAQRLCRTAVPLRPALTRLDGPPCAY